jgi:transcriptional regulator with XRE-family HTH domain
MTEEMSAEQFRRWRTRLGWTQEHAADMLGVAVVTVRKWEYGLNKVNLTASKLARRLAQDSASGPPASTNEG